MCSPALRFLQEDFVVLIPSASFYLLIQFCNQFVLKLQRQEGSSKYTITDITDVPFSQELPVDLKQNTRILPFQMCVPD